MMGQNVTMDMIFIIQHAMVVLIGGVFSGANAILHLNIKNKVIP